MLRRSTWFVTLTISPIVNWIRYSSWQVVSLVSYYWTRSNIPANQVWFMLQCTALRRRLLTTGNSYEARQDQSRLLLYEWEAHKVFMSFPTSSLPNSLSDAFLLYLMVWLPFQTTLCIYTNLAKGETNGMSWAVVLTYKVQLFYSLTTINRGPITFLRYELKSCE
jgi:hypothetical protein